MQRTIQTKEKSTKIVKELQNWEKSHQNSYQGANAPKVHQGKIASKLHPEINLIITTVIIE